MKIIQVVDEDGWVFHLKQSVYTQYLFLPDTIIYLEWIEDITPYLHNEEGPAVDIPDIHSRSPLNIHYLNGIEYTKEQWEVEVAKIKFNKKLLDVIN